VPRRLRIAGPLGITEVAIGDGGARIAASPCPHQLCVRRGRLERAGQLAACVPNRVLVEIAGRRRPGALDGVSR